MTGDRKAGRMPAATEFCMVVTSLVRRVTREELLKWSVLAKENCCSFANSALRISAPSAHALAAPGREHGGALAQHKGDKGKENHLQPFHQDIAPVSIDHAHIHNGSHDQGDDELKHGFGFNTEDGHDGIPFVGLQIR